MMSEERVHNPWNEKNVLISPEEISKILRRYGIQEQIRKQELFQRACVHKSYSVNTDISEENRLKIVERPSGCLDLQKENNERLEFIGDAILGCAIAMYLQRRQPGEGEGFQTRLRTKLVNNKTLGLLVQKMGLHKWMIISQHVEERCNGRKNLKILGGLFESWVGAICKEQELRGVNGFEIASQFIIRVMEQHIDFGLTISEDYNQKDQLLKLFHKVQGETPRQREVNVKGPPQDRVQEMGVIDPRDEEKVLGTGIARSKKLAEQIASKNVVQVISDK